MMNLNTQRSLIVSGLILVCGAVAIWRNSAAHRQLQETQARLQQLMQESGATSMASSRGGDARSAQRNPKDREAIAKAVAGTVEAFTWDMQQRVKQAKQGMPRATDEAWERRSIEMTEELEKLDASQLEIALAELENHPELENKQHAIQILLYHLVQKYPADALAWYVETGGAEGAKSGSPGMVSLALAQLAEHDLIAALKWLETHAVSHPEWTADASKISILESAVKQDPKLALQLAGELGVKDLRSVSLLVAGAIAPEDRLAMLDSWRASLPAVTDPEGRKTLQDNLLRSLAQQVVHDGYESGIAWLQEANLSEMETRIFWAAVKDAQPREEAGKWFEWALQRYPMQEVSGYMEWQLKKWMRYDYRAAGEWLNGAHEGPLKQLAARSYAETLAPYDPEVATQWALTLQDANQRQRLLQTVHKELGKKDAAAAAEFAQKHGL